MEPEQKLPPSVMLRVPTALAPIVRQMAAVYRDALKTRHGYDGKQKDSGRDNPE